MRLRTFLCLAPMFLAATLALGASSDLWLHVHVQEDGENPETVRVNVPLSLIEEVLPLIEHEQLSGGKVKMLDEFEAEGVDLRGVWNALREAEDGDYVTVQSNDETVRVSKIKGYFVVKVEEEDERVNVRVPLDVVDALFSAGEDEIDVLAAIEALGRHAGEEMITVQEESSKVRIWIDAKKEIAL